MKVLVTGASGNVGREVVRILQQRGVPLRITGRAGGARSGAVAGPGAESVPLDFQDASTFAAAARGCDAVFLLRPPPVSDTKATLNPFIDVARAEGVAQVVFLSVAGAGSNPVVPHHAVEKHLEARGGQWTILRPGFFAQNLGDAYRQDIAVDDRILVPAGRGRAAFVDVRDVAELAANALTAPDDHRAQAYTLTGPQPVSFDEAAELLSEGLGRRITYVPASIPRYAWHLRARGLPVAQIAVQTILHVGLRFGQAESVDPTLERLLGRPPRTLRDYVMDHLSLWQRG